MASFASFAGVQPKLLSNTMKRVTRHFIFSSQNPSSFHLLSNPTLIFYTTQTSSSTPPPHSHNLTSDELNKINLLLPRLCESNHLHEAIRLIDTALLTNPKPLNSLPLPILIDRLSQEPNMTQSMALLNRLKHNPSSHFSLPYITKLLVNSYFKKRRFKEVMKVVGWVWRIDSPFEMDVGLYRILVKGFCRSYMTLEALIVVKRMVEDKVVVGDDLRNWVYKSLLREARIKEAKELNAALSCDLGNGKDDDLRRVVALLDQIITKWTD